MNPGSNPGSPARGPAGTGWFATLKRTATEFRDDNLSDWAAALTYYGLLSLFPALIALVSLVGLVGDPESTTETLTEIVAALGPDSAVETFSGPIESIASNRSAAGFALVLGLAVALWSASGYVGAFMRASNVIYETPEGRPFWKLRPLQLLVTLAMVLLTAIVALGLVLTGPIVEAVA
ncbi:MAG TPA: YihY/virulence factor BrkB family protein, partial [Solirubrobacterales bacterium]|nr:YihY/virulence factor BrkB family protein [Solirubrobacterales bacterium]